MRIRSHSRCGLLYYMMQFNQINLVGLVEDWVGMAVLPVLEGSIWGRGWDLSFRTRGLGCSLEGSLSGESPLSISEGCYHLCCIGFTDVWWVAALWSIVTRISGVILRIVGLTASMVACIGRIGVVSTPIASCTLIVVGVGIIPHRVGRIGRVLT